MDRNPKQKSAMSELRTAAKSSKHAKNRKKETVLKILDFLEKYGKAVAIGLCVLIVTVIVVSVVGGKEDKTVPEKKEIKADLVVGGSSLFSKEASDAPAPTPLTPPERFTVRFTFYGKEDIVCTTEKRTVGELIELLSIPIENSDKEKLDLDRLITEDCEIAIDTLSNDTVTEEYTIDYEIQYIDDSSMQYGTNVTEQEGKEGVGCLEYQVTVLNGVEIERVQTNSYIKSYPVNCIIRRGTGGTVNIGGELYTYSKYIPNCDTTVYTVYSGQGYTASGLPADESVIAVDTNVIPMFSKVYIEGIGIRIAADRGTAIVGNIVDIYYDYDNPMFANYGRQYRDVYILN